MKYYKIEIPEFPSHIISGKRKTMPDKYKKLNYNSFESLHAFEKGSIRSELHKFLDPHIPYQLDIDLPITVDVSLIVPVNWDRVQRNKSTGIIKWKKPNDGYNINWDAFNAVTIWRKIIEDVLTEHNIYPDDTVEFLRGGSGYVKEFCQDFKDRKLIIELKSI